VRAKSPTKTKVRYTAAHSNDPPQEDPLPAVQPKQCIPETIFRPASSCRSKSLMWLGAPCPMGNLSAKLKSQS